METQIKLMNAVLHILDNNINLPVLSNNELELEGEVSEFLEKHLIKILCDNNLKSSKFSGTHNKVYQMIQEILNSSENFLMVSHQIVNRLFEIMVKNVDIASADVICCLFEADRQAYFGILKLNYKTGFTHHVLQASQGNSNTLIKYQTLLPSDTQKIDEGILINLEDFNIRLIENAYEINGEKDFYLSKIFLECETDLSNNEKLKILNKVTQKINKKYFDEDFEKVAKLKKTVAESLEEASVITVSNIAEKVYDRNIGIQQEYVEEVYKAGLTEKELYIPEELALKKFKTHRIKTDTGIEINFPLELFDDNGKLEFVNNPDGTISILIKNVTKITNR
jgi:hypothetical protein